MFDLSSLKTDPEKSLKGTWVDYRGGSRLLVSRSNNEEIEQFKLQKALEHADVFQAGGKEAEELAEKVETEALARFVLRDWSGMTIDGEEVEYTPELGMKIFADPHYADFREDVKAISANRGNYRPQAEAAATEAVKKTAAS